MLPTHGPKLSNLGPLDLFVVAGDVGNRDRLSLWIFADWRVAGR